MKFDITLNMGFYWEKGSVPSEIKEELERFVEGEVSLTKIWEEKEVSEWGLIIMGEGDEAPIYECIKLFDKLKVCWSALLLHAVEKKTGLVWKLSDTGYESSETDELEGFELVCNMMDLVDLFINEVKPYGERHNNIPPELLRGDLETRRIAYTILRLRNLKRMKELGLDAPREY